MSKVVPVKNSSDVDTQSESEIMMYVQFDDVPSTEINVSTDSLSNKSMNGEGTTPVATGVNDVEAVLPSTFSPVEPLESDAKQSCLIPDVETQLIRDAESTISGSTTPPKNRSDSKPDKAFTTKSVVDAVGLIRRFECFDGFTVRQQRSDICPPEVTDIEAVLPPIFPLVEPLESDAKQSCLIPDVETQLIGDTESTSGSSKLPVHEISGPQDLLTRDGCGDATRNVTAVRSKRRLLWSRAKRFVRRMLCCGAIDMDR